MKNCRKVLTWGSPTKNLCELSCKLPGPVSHGRRLNQYHAGLGSGGPRTTTGQYLTPVYHIQIVVQEQIFRAPKLGGAVPNYWPVVTSLLPSSEGSVTTFM